MVLGTPSGTEIMGTPHGSRSNKSNSGFVTVEWLLTFDADEDKEKVLGLMRRFLSMIRKAGKFSP